MRYAILITLAGCMMGGPGSGFLGADDARETAIRRNRERIRGTWRIVELEVDGRRADDAEARKLTVVNSPDGGWRLYSEGQEISGGTSTLNPIEMPHEIDIRITAGASAGSTCLGIYELSEKSRRLCFAPPDFPRPTEFSSFPGTERILVTFEREPADPSN